MGACASADWGCCFGRDKAETCAPQEAPVVGGAALPRLLGAAAAGTAEAEELLGDGQKTAPDNSLADDRWQLRIRNGFYEVVGEASAPELVRSRSCHAVLQPVRRKESLIFCDWDDTLCPTTWLKEQGYIRDGLAQPVEAADAAALASLAASVQRSLELLRSCGEVVVVTAAEEGWAQWCCQRFLPSLAPLLGTVRVVSAQTCHKAQEPDASKWKHWAFAAEVARAFGDLDAWSSSIVLPHLVSIGDGGDERQALQDVARAVKARGKVLRFFEQPDLEALAEQHELLQESFLGFFGQAGDVDTTTWQDEELPAGSAATEAPETGEP